MAIRSIEDQIIREAKNIAPYVKAALQEYEGLEEFDDNTLRRINKLQRMYELVTALKEEVDSLILTELYSMIISEVSVW